MRSNKKRYAKKAGMAPGSLIYTGGYTDQATAFTRVDYHPEAIDIRRSCTEEEALAPFAEGVNTWLHVVGLTDEALMEKIGNRFGIHRLLLEDIMNVEQQPKVVDQGDTVFVTLKDITFNAATEQMQVEQVSLLMGAGYLISFREKPGGLVDAVAERLTLIPRLRSRGTDYLLYLICDRIVDQYFVVLEEFENKLDDIEEMLLRRPDRFKPERLLSLRKEFSWLRRQVSPLLEEFRKLAGNDISLIPESGRIYMRDVHDHLVQVSHTMENFRETYSSLLDFYVSQRDLKMNQIMKRLTVVATVFMPLSFIAGFYGMNFTTMPELTSTWGYPAVIGLMLATASGMLWWFRKGNFR